MMRIKTSLLYRLSLNNVFIIALGLILTFIGFCYPLFYIVLAVYLIYIALKNKTLAFIILILITIFFLYLIFLSHYLSYINKNTATGMVRSVIVRDYGYRYIISQGFLRYGVIDSTTGGFKVGDIIYAQGTNEGLTSSTIEYGYSAYFRYLSERYVIHLEEATLTLKGHKITYLSLKESVYQFLMRDNTGSSLMTALILGDHSLMDEDVYNSFSTNGVTHLFAVSGLHVDMLISVLDHILSRFKKASRFKSPCITLFLVFYMLVTQLTPSIVRAASLYILKNFCEKYHLSYRSFDRLSLILLAMILINPLYLLQGSFTLSFISSATIILLQPLLKNKKPFKRSLILSTLLTIITLPYSVYYNQSINLLTPLLNIVFIALVTYIIFPLTLLTLITPHLTLIQEAYSALSELFYQGSLVLSHQALKIYLPYFSPLIIVLFYGVIFLIITLIKVQEYLNVGSKKAIITRILNSLLALGLVIFLLIIRPINHKIIFLDTYQGDATVIAVNQHYYLIDTGRGDNEAVTRYLINHNIKTLEAVIITHNDSDHNGEYETLKSHLTIKSLILNFYDDYTYHCVNTRKVWAGQSITLGDMTLNILAPAQDLINPDSNTTSLVFTVTLENTTFLFTGDSPYSTLEELNYPAIDILKVSHHGSKTGTSAAFLEKITSTFRSISAVIMTGHVEKFNFPHESVMSLLKEYHFNIYATKDLGSITYDLKKKTWTSLTLEKAYGLW